MIALPRRPVLHLACVAAIAALLALVMVYPFMPGRHDPLAVPLASGAQVFGVAGLALVPVGAGWIVLSRHGFVWSVLGLAVGVVLALLLSLFATLSTGTAFGLLTLAACTSLLEVIAATNWPPNAGFHAISVSPSTVRSTASPVSPARSCAATRAAISRPDIVPANSSAQGRAVPHHVDSAPATSSSTVEPISGSTESAPHEASTGATYKVA